MSGFALSLLRSWSSCASAALALTLAACSTAPPPPSAGKSPPSELAFTSVQPELLGVAGSFANAWGDFDNDGDLDLAVSLSTGEVRLYRNDSGTLVSVGADVGMPQAGSHELRGLSWGDFDGDGFIDLLGGSTPTDKPTKVLRNEGGRRFTDVAASVGLTIPGRSARQTNWIDYDNDGDLDVYAADRSGDNKLFRNDDGTFVQVFEGAGPTDARPTVGACWLDMDNDGDLDLYLANQSGAADAMWRNDGAAFVDVAPALGMTGPPRTKDEGGVGCADRRLRQRWRLRYLRRPTTATTCCTATTATARSPRSARRPASVSRTTRSAPTGATTTTMATSICRSSPTKARSASRHR